MLKYEKGRIVTGQVTGIEKYGIFVSLDEFYSGLIHISEFSDNFVKTIREFVSVGQEIRLRVLEVDEENKKVKLSYKQLHKTRGIKCRVPEYNIGFETLDEKLAGWIEKYKLED